MKTFAEERRRMVEKQIASRGVVDPRVLDAMRTVPREAFVPASASEFAYEDTPLAIEEGQTISQPYVVALMAEALRLTPRDRVLEIGAGSGYAAAVLSRVATEVYAMERHAVLAELARRRIRELGYHNVHILHGDGTLGCAEHAPYDAIVVAAGGPSVPEALRAQLVIGGRLVIPVGATRQEQELVRVTRTGENEYEQEGLGDVRFVPLIGVQGWDDRASAPETVAPGG
jgi:protein-L-isoaspartate(D-aspartate) O-methyltransferase